MNLRQFPFYEKARRMWEDTQLNQIVKGLHKYEEPFTPNHWTANELLTHALEESVDQVHYLVGLKELVDGKDKEIERLKREMDVLKAQNAVMKHSLEYSMADMPTIIIHKKPSYFDLDD